MRVEIVAIGTELLLGQIVDTNSVYVAERLAESGIDCLYQTRVGDNLERIVDVLNVALGRSDAIITCGGLGPTQDDITREALATVMGVDLVRDRAAFSLVKEVFARRNRVMSPSNERQGDVPFGAKIIEQRLGTAPGIIAPMGEKVIYSVPGVPDELKEMITRAVIPDLIARSGPVAVIASRVIRTWGLAESVLGETVAPRLEALDGAGGAAPTIAFLASGIEGIKVRLTVKAPNVEIASKSLDAEEVAIRALLGDAVFGVDDETMEASVGKLLKQHDWTIAIAESFTGGLICSRIVAVPGASEWFRGGVVTYASDTKASLLGIPDGPVISAATAAAMAAGVKERFAADVGLATTGVAGPGQMEGHAVGTAFVGVAIGKDDATAQQLQLSGDRAGRQRIREIGTISSLDVLRRQLIALSH